MYRILCAAAALLTFGIATLSAAADDRDACGAWLSNREEAVAACSRLIERNPRDADAYFNRGRAYGQKDDYDRAIADYDLAIRLNAKADFYLYRAGAYRSKHDDDRAIADYDRAISLDPKMANAYFNRGDTYNQKGDYDRAIADLDQVIKLGSKTWLSYSIRALAYLRKGEYDRAIADYDEAIELAPEQGARYVARGEAYKLKHDYDRATADFDRAINLYRQEINRYPASAWYRARGNAYSAKGDYDRAIADYDQAIRLDPKDTAAYNARGEAYFDKGEYAPAIAEFDQALKLKPAHAKARQNRERAQAALAAQLPAPSQALPPAQASPPRQATSPISAERRVALVIGNSGYTSGLVSALPNPRRDAMVVADALRQAGFETVELTDLDRGSMVKALQSFRAKADGADWALVYFAGHGIEVNRVNYLIPVDAKLADSRDVKHETVSYEDIADAIGGAKALRIIILDACRNNPFKAQMRQTAALRGSLDRGLAAPPETEPGTLVVYSAKEGQAAIDGDRVNSPFALAFVARLKMPGREVQRMFDDVRDDVLNATDKRQQPYKYGSLPGSRDFFFVAGK